MRRRSGRPGGVVAVCAALTLVLAACSGTTPTRSRVQAALVTSGLPQSEARCATRQLFSVLSKGQLRDLAERGSGALDDKTSTALSTAIATCVPGVGSATTTPTTAPASATTKPQTAPSASKP